MTDKALKASMLVILGLMGYTLGNIFGNGFVSAQVQSKVALVKLNPIVRLIVDGRTFCSGTIVSNTLLITAAHCVVEETPFGSTPNTKSIEIRASDNKPIGVTARAVYASPQMDQAMMVGRFDLFEPKPFIQDPQTLTETKKKGQKFTSCGYPLNGDLYCNETSFAGNDHFFWAVNGVLIPGMSGGPTMLPSGALVAVNVAVVERLSIVSPIYNITKNLPRKK